MFDSINSGLERDNCTKEHGNKCDNNECDKCD